jgi:hypothetical protein
VNASTSQGTRKPEGSAATAPALVRPSVTATWMRAAGSGRNHPAYSPIVMMTGPRPTTPTARTDSAASSATSPAASTSAAWISGSLSRELRSQIATAPARPITPSVHPSRTGESACIGRAALTMLNRPLTP